MSYLLAGSSLRNPQQITETTSVQVAQQRTLSGAINRDYFGSKKRIWVLEYRNTKKADYDTIKTIYDTHLTSGAAQTWSSTEANYTIAATSVHVDLLVRKFTTSGTDYISDFTLTLTEA